MSWEEMSVDKHPCPCGKGTYSVTHRMDDWNKIQTLPCRMDCEECRVTFVLLARAKIGVEFHIQSNSGSAKQLKLNTDTCALRLYQTVRKRKS